MTKNISFDRFSDNKFKYFHKKLVNKVAKTW